MNELAKLRKKMREAFANYRKSEGCPCCEGFSHDKDAEVIAKLLNVPKYKDGSGYNFYKYANSGSDVKEVKDD